MFAISNNGNSARSISSENDLLDGETLSEFMPDIPEGAPIKPVTRRQFKLGLLAIGLLDDVEAAIAASGDRALQINYAEALDFERNNPFVLQMSQALGKTDAEIDALFQLATSL